MTPWLSRVAAISITLESLNYMIRSTLLRNKSISNASSMPSHVTSSRLSQFCMRGIIHIWESMSTVWWGSIINLIELLAILQSPFKQDSLKSEHNNPITVISSQIWSGCTWTLKLLWLTQGLFDLMPLLSQGLSNTLNRQILLKTVL